MEKRNILVDSKNSKLGWLYFEQSTINTTHTGVLLASGTDFQDLPLPGDQVNVADLSNFTRGTQAFLCIQYVDIISAVSLPPVFASYSIVNIDYRDWYGIDHHIGKYSTFDYSKPFHLNKIIPVPITDFNMQSLGQLGVTAIAGTAAPATGDYYMTFGYSIVYMSPDSDSFAIWSRDLQENNALLNTCYRQIMDSLVPESVS
jgi:hypothetical protein